MRIARTPFVILLLLASPIFFACSKSSADADKKTLNLCAWSEYVPREVIDGFTAETGIEVNYDTFDSNENLLAKLDVGGGSYDVIQPSEYASETLIAEHRLAPLDMKLIPNAAHLDPAFTHLAFDPKQEFTMPYMAGTVCIVVNTERVKSEVRGFADLFDDKFKGRIVCLRDDREIVVWALLTLKKDINDITPETLKAVRPIVERWTKLVKVWDSDSPKKVLKDGDVDLGVVWSGEAAFLMRDDKRFKCVMPIEGSHMYVDSFAVPANAKNKEAAMKFIDYCLRPEVSKKISAAFPYTNPNADARKLLTPDELKNPASYPDMRGFPTFRALGKRAALIDAMMSEVRAGS